MYKQRTLDNSVSCEGIGLHSGKTCGMVLHPAPEGHGIVFTRSDLADARLIPATAQYIKSTMNASTLGINGTRISTVEHLMAAFYGLGVDNALVEVDAPELPIMDGSAGPFVELLREAGITEQDRGKRVIVIRKPVRAEQENKYAEFLPSGEFKVRCSISFDHPMLALQSRELVFSGDLFESEIASARTFGFLHEVEALKAHGLALGGSLQNAVVLDREKVLNVEGLRYEDEFVRHKILDTLGDLMLLGAPVIGHFIAHRSGHALNHKLVKTLLETPEAYDVVELNSENHDRKNGFTIPNWVTPTSDSGPKYLNSARVSL